jgi:hypothetical protein
MSGKLMGQVYKLALPSSERDVLLAVCETANDDGTAARPGVPYLAWELDIEERTVRRILASLRAKGLIEAVAYSTGGAGRATEYTVHLERGTPKPPRVKKQREYPDTIVSPFYKEDVEKTLTFQDENPDKSTLNPDPAESYHPSIHPSIDPSLTLPGAGARESQRKPNLSKTHAARKAHQVNPPPRSATPSQLIASGDGLADIEALMADPLLWQLAQAWADVAGAPVHLLTAANGESLAALRAELGEGLTGEHIREAKRITGDNRPNNPTAWFRSMLRKAVEGKLNTKAPTTPGARSNGHGHAPPSTTDWQAAAATNTNNGRPPPRPRAPCGYPGCTSQAPPGLPSAKYCNKHGQGPQYQRPKEIYKAFVELQSATR